MTTSSMQGVRARLALVDGATIRVAVALALCLTVGGVARKRPRQ